MKFALFIPFILLLGLVIGGWAPKEELRAANKEIIRAHLGCCVKEAFEQGNEDEKIEELLAVMDKLAK